MRNAAYNETSMFFLSTDNNEKGTMSSKSGSSITRIASNTIEFIQRFFDLLMNWFKTGLEQNMKGVNFIFGYISDMILIS